MQISFRLSPNYYRSPWIETGQALWTMIAMLMTWRVNFSIPAFDDLKRVVEEYQLSGNPPSEVKSFHFVPVTPTEYIKSGTTSVFNSRVAHKSTSGSKNKKRETRESTGYIKTCLLLVDGRLKTSGFRIGATLAPNILNFLEILIYSQLHPVAVILYVRPCFWLIITRRRNFAQKKTSS